MVLFLILAIPSAVSAQHTSPDYQIDEIFIGSGGELDACSADFCAQQSAGGTTGGESSSDEYGIIAGFGSPADPFLSMVVDGSTNIDMGVLNTSTTSAASTSFKITSYLSSGYVVRVHGDAPTNNSGPVPHSLAALNSPTSSSFGTEQFGINLVANDEPGIGANPQQFPDNTFAYGEPSIGYDQADHFKYVDGDIIAESISESGETSYTMSIISNVSNATPGGRYTTMLVIQAIATF